MRSRRGRLVTYRHGDHVVVRWKSLTANLERGKVIEERRSSNVLDFFADRLKVQQREAGVRHDLIDAVFALGGEDDLVRLLARVKALQAFVETAGGHRPARRLQARGEHPQEGGLAADGRIRDRQDRSGPTTTADAEEDGPDRDALDRALEPQSRGAAIEAEDFEGAMAALASLRAPIDAFFDKVTVNDPDPAKRAARLTCSRGCATRSTASPISRRSRADRGGRRWPPPVHLCRTAGGSDPMTQYVYRFGGGVSDGGKGDKELARRQGREPRRDGVDRPAGAAGLHHLDRDVRALLRRGRELPRQPAAPRSPTASRISRRSPARRFGDAADPLLVSVRSGARVSMPGMMDTVLNLGLNDATVAGPRRGQRRRRASPGTAIAASSRCMPTSCSASIMARSRKRSRSPRRTRASTSTPSSTPTTGRRWSADYKALVEEELGQALPAGRRTTSSGARSARCSARGSRDRAKVYRRLNDIPDDWGTAVNVQAMVFGNMGDTSATGVAFTRDPVDRRARLLRRISDQRAGRGRRRRHPHAAISDPAPRARRRAPSRCRWKRRCPRSMPSSPRVFDLLETPLSRHAGHRVHRRARQAVDAADPHRQAHRQGRAARSRSTWPSEGLISEEEAVLRVDPSALDQLLHPTLDPDAPRDVHRQGPAGLARRGLRQGGVRRRHRRAAAPAMARR